MACGARSAADPDVALPLGLGGSQPSVPLWRHNSVSGTKSIPRALGFAAWGAVVVSSLVLSGCDGATDSGSSSSHTPGPSVTSPAEAVTRSRSASSTSAPARAAAAQRIIDALNAHSFDSSVDGRGDLLTIWSSGYHYARPTALAIRDENGEQALALGPPRTHVLAALPNGWLVRGNGGLVRLDNHANTDPVTETHGGSIRPRPGDIAYSWGNVTSAYRPATNTTYTLNRLLGRVRGRGAVITADGALLTLARHDGTVAAARLRDGRWSSTTLDAGTGVAAGGIAGSGQNIIALTTYHPAPLGDGAEDPVHRVAVSTDAGEHWHSAGVPGGESVVLSMAVTRSGTGFVTIGAPRGPCSLLRVDNAATASCVKVPTIQVFTHDDRVYSTYFRDRRMPYRLQISDNQGKTWRPTPVPGRS